LAAAELRFTMAPFFLSTMPGSTMRVMYTVDVTLSSSSDLTCVHEKRHLRCQYRVLDTMMRSPVI
jgi:hypothetical protein